MALVRADGQRLLVASSWDHFGFYDPASGKWADAPMRTANEWTQHVRDIDASAFRASFAHYQLPINSNRRMAPPISIN